MNHKIKSFLFFISGVIMLFNITTCNPGNKTDSSKKISGQKLPAVENCNPENYKYPKEVAMEDSSIYNTVIDVITPPSVFAVVENPTVGYFPISLNSIEELKKMELNCEILPAEGSDDPSWFYFAMRPGSAPEKDTITAYFVCYKGKKDASGHCVATDELAFFDLGNPDKLIPIPPKEARNHMKKFQKYIDDRIKPLELELFYPYGFQLPWCDLVAVGENLGNNKDNQVNCVLVIKSKRDDPNVPAVSMLIRTFKHKKSSKAVRAEGDEDEDEYYDFVNPCPNSCIP